MLKNIPLATLYLIIIYFSALGLFILRFLKTDDDDDDDDSDNHVVLLLVI